MTADDRARRRELAPREGSVSRELAMRLLDAIEDERNTLMGALAKALDIAERGTWHSVRAGDRDLILAMRADFDLPSEQDGQSKKGS